MNIKFNHLDCLYNYKILDTPKDPIFDDITFLAANMCQVPFSIISFIDNNRQWNKSCFGLTLHEVNLNDSFCVHTLNSCEILEIEDTLNHPKFKSNQYVIRDPSIRFYAGVPLITPEGHQIGALCVFDTKPNKLSLLQKQLLQKLANQVIGQLKLNQNIHELDKAKTKLDEAQETAKIGNWDWNLITNELTWSKNQYKLFGHELGTPISYDLFLSHLTPEEQIETNKAVNNSLQQQEGFLREHEVCTKDGNKRIFLETGRVEFNNDVPVRMFGTTQDITEVRNLQIQLSQQQKALVQTSKMALMGQMAGGIAHEINNPLAVLVAHLGLQMEDENCSESLKKSLIKMMSICQNIAEVVKGLRLMSPKENGEPKNFHSVNKIVTKVVSLYNEKFKKTNIDLSLISHEDLTICCSEVEFSQVLFNLLNNSIEAISSQSNPWIKIKIERDNEFLNLSIIDSGSIIDDRIKEKLFTPFFTTKKTGYGMGLGLSISYGIINDHGGTLTFNNQSGNTCFYIKMPCK